MRREKWEIWRRMVYGNSEITLGINFNLLLSWFCSVEWPKSPLFLWLFPFSSESFFLFCYSFWPPLKKTLQNLYFICNIVQLSKPASLLYKVLTQRSFPISNTSSCPLKKFWNDPKIISYSTGSQMEAAHFNHLWIFIKFQCFSLTPEILIGHLGWGLHILIQIRGLSIKYLAVYYEK